MSCCCFIGVSSVRPESPAHTTGDRSGLVMDIGFPAFPEGIWVQGELLGSKQFFGRFFQSGSHITDLGTTLVWEKQNRASVFSSFFLVEGMKSVHQACNFWGFLKEILEFVSSFVISGSNYLPNFFPEELAQCTAQNSAKSTI